MVVTCNELNEETIVVSFSNMVQQILLAVWDKLSVNLPGDQCWDANMAGVTSTHDRPFGRTPQVLFATGIR